MTKIGFASRVRLKGTPLVGRVTDVITFDGNGETFYGVTWDGVGFDTRHYRVDELEAAPGQRVDSSLYDISPYDRLELEKDRLKAWQAGYKPRGRT